MSERREKKLNLENLPSIDQSAMSIWELKEWFEGFKKQEEEKQNRSRNVGGLWKIFKDNYLGDPTFDRPNKVSDFLAFILGYEHRGKEILGIDKK